MHYLLYSYSYVIVQFLVLINSIVFLNTLDIHISINTFLFENINVNIGMTVPYSHLLYLINGSIISGAKRCLQINERQLYLCRWRTTSSQSGAILAVEWMRSHSVFPVAVVVRFMTLEQLAVNYLPSALQWDTDTWSHVLMPLIMACLPSVRADCSG